MQPAGRPLCDIDLELVRSHRRAGLAWSDIRRLLHVSTSTLQRWRRLNALEVANCLSAYFFDCRSSHQFELLKSDDIFLVLLQFIANEHTDESLDALVSAYTRNHPARGERMVLGMLRSSSDMSFTRAQACLSIERVDDGGLFFRREEFGRRIIR